MKKVFLLGLVVFFIAAFSGLSYASVDETFEIAIINVKGFVQVDEKGTDSWEPALVGTKLKTGAKIKTGSDGIAEIVYDAAGLNLVRLDENTQITVQKSIVDLYDGSVMGNFRNIQPGSEFRIKTPNTICGIRGTGVGVLFSRGTTITDVRSYFGTVFIQGIDRNGNPVSAEVEVPAGWQRRVFVDGNFSPPNFINNNDRLVWYAWIRGLAGDAGTGALAQAAAALAEAGMEPDPQDLDQEKQDEADAKKEEGQPSVSP
ncbi:MAG: FecR domain-containing protein [Candidatus Omnitrophota bacterium]